MTPKFARVVDPIFLYTLELLERIARRDPVSPQEEQVRLRALIDQGDALFGAEPEWDAAKYALVSWIDEVLVDTPWDGQDWWSNNVLEVALFNSRLCNEKFYLRAAESSSLSRRDALEVYYVCAVLGFRGLYRDPEQARYLIQSHSLPEDLDTWARQAALSIRLGQGRPPLSRPGPEIAGAPPAQGKSQVVWPWLAVAMLVAWNVVYFTLFL
jgi:type VI secretion system protein ImpK